MNRRVFLWGLTLGMLVGPLRAEAQHGGKVWRIGVLTTGNLRSAPAANWEGFLQGLRDSGYVAGQNVAFDNDMRKANRLRAVTIFRSATNPREPWLKD